MSIDLVVEFLKSVLGAENPLNALIAVFGLIVVLWLHGDTITSLARIVINRGLNPNIGFLTKLTLGLFVYFFSPSQQRQYQGFVTVIAAILVPAAVLFVLLWFIHDQSKERLASFDQK